VHALSPQLAKEGAIPRGAEGAIFHGARQLTSINGAHHYVSLDSKSPAAFDRLHYLRRINEYLQELPIAKH
jgi:hypothetical protein